MTDLYTVFARTSSAGGKITAFPVEGMETPIALATQQAQARKQFDFPLANPIKMPQPLREAADIYERYDEELNRLARFIVDRGSYPWDVVS
jgi:hypothetical protein